MSKLSTISAALAYASISVAIITAAQPGPAFPQDTTVTTRVVDVGPGLCTITRIPNPEPDQQDYYLIYDAGHWVGGQCIDAVNEIVEGEDIDLLVISHSDSDHLGDADEILEQYNVWQVIRTGFRRDTSSWRNFNEGVGSAVENGGSVINLQTLPITPGEQLELGNAVVTLIAGWNEWTDPGPTESERRNAVSIVVRLEYNNRSILFTGDTVGKRLDDPDTECKDAEAVMVQRHDAGDVLLTSDVIIAPHHGANNGNSTCFIEAVDPEFVVFSAGHAHQHPTEAAKDRYLAQGVQEANIFRTDRGDTEEGDFHWDDPNPPQANCRDGRGDDDILIEINATGDLRVDYASSPPGPCLD